MPDLTFSNASEALDGLDCELGIGTGSTGTGGKADGIAADACAAGSAVDENGGDGAGGAGGAGGPWQGFRHPRVDSKLAKCDLWSNMSHVSLMFVSLVRLRRDLRRPSQNMEIYQALKPHPIKQRKTL